MLLLLHPEKNKHEHGHLKFAKNWMRKKLDLKSFARISRDFHAWRKTEKKSDVENQNSNG